MKENYYSEIFKNDMPGLAPDPAIEKRLAYILHLRAKERKPSENSFMAFFTGFFNMQNFGIKAGIITAMFLFTFIFQRIPENGTFHINNNTLLADSSQCDTAINSFYNAIDIVE